jgi:hypothetical protein
MLNRFVVVPLWSYILSIKNSPALRAATSMGSKLDEGSYLNSQRFETCVSVVLWVSRSCMKYLSPLTPTTMQGPAIGIRSFSRAPSGGFNKTYELTGNMSISGEESFMWNESALSWLSLAISIRRLWTLIRRATWSDSLCSATSAVPLISDLEELAIRAPRRGLYLFQRPAPLGRRQSCHAPSHS